MPNRVVEGRLFFTVHHYYNLNFPLCICKFLKPRGVCRHQRLNQVQTSRRWGTLLAQLLRGEAPLLSGFAKFLKQAHCRTWKCRARIRFNTSKKSRGVGRRLAKTGWNQRPSFGRGFVDCKSVAPHSQDTTTCGPVPRPFVWKRINIPMWSVEEPRRGLSENESVSCSVVSHSLRPHGL